MNLIADYREKRVIHDDLLSFLKDIDCNVLQFKLLCCFGRHPRLKLSLYTIASSSNTSKINFRAAIKALVEKGIIVVRNDINGLTTYTLSSDQRIQRYIGELVTLDWSEKMNLVKQMNKQAESDITGHL